MAPDPVVGALTVSAEGLVQVPARAFVRLGRQHVQPAYQFDAAAPFVVDLSFGWDTCTGAALAGIGAAGVIGYAGCADTAKNVSAERFADWGDHGLMRALVLENGPTDLNKGTASGKAQGAALAKAAEELGYDLDNCWGALAADYNVPSADYNAIEDAVGAAGEYLPHPCLYSPSGLLDHVHGSNPGWFLWQSDSASFSSLHPTPNAHLNQRYDDPRAKGLPVDINDVVRVPLGLMGETDMLDANDPVVKTILNTITAVPAATWAQALTDVDTTGKPDSASHTMGFWVTHQNANAATIMAQLAALSAKQVDPSALAQQLITLLVPAITQAVETGGTSATADQIAQAVVADIGQLLNPS